MENLKLNIEKVYSFVSKEAIYAYKNEILVHNQALHNKTGKGSEYTGWVNLPSSITDEQLTEMEKVAAYFKEKTQIVVVIGIGGSYLGAKAVIDSLSHNFRQLLTNEKSPVVLFAGNNISEDYHFELREVLKDYSYGLIVISKSGTTTEPAIAFRLLKQDVEEKYGKDEARRRIVAITDEKRGALRKVADQEGYKSFVISDDIGGRYSVLTPVGLLPIACSGFDIREMVKGAQQMETLCGTETSFEENPAAVYASARNALYRHGKNLEILVNYNPKLCYLSEWWKQLYGESEGKEHMGIFPASVNFTADLHSMGQYIQEGTRNIFEVVISIKETNHRLLIPNDPDDVDGLNFLANRPMDEVNKKAELGTLLAHIDGGVPNIHIEIPKLNEFYVGQLLYFFEKACGISGYTLGINPFNQPGVEAYKINMFALLGKPGFELQAKLLQEQLKK